MGFSGEFVRSNPALTVKLLNLVEPKTDTKKLCVVVVFHTELIVVGSC